LNDIERLSLGEDSTSHPSQVKTSIPCAVLPYSYAVKFMALRRTRFLTFSVLSLSLASTLLTGCAAGPNAATRLITQVTDGVEGQAGSIKLRNMTLVIQPDSSAVLVGTIVNQDEATDAVIGIAINGAQASIGRAGGLVSELPLELNKPVIFEGPSANAFAFVESLGAKPGYRVPVLVILANSGIVELSVLVRDRTAEFIDVARPVFTPTED
jgi:hypothetical protein